MRHMRFVPEWYPLILLVRLRGALIVSQALALSIFCLILCCFYKVGTSKNTNGQ